MENTKMKSCITTFTLLFFAFFFNACSEGVEETAEPGSVRAQAEQIGHEAAQAIKAPMEKAQISVDQENDRIRELEKKLNE